VNLKKEAHTGPGRKGNYDVREEGGRVSKGFKGGKPSLEQAVGGGGGRGGGEKKQ